MKFVLKHSLPFVIILLMCAWLHESSDAFAQDRAGEDITGTSIDSLYAIIQKLPKNDTVRINKLNDVAYNLYRSQPRVTERFAREAIAEAEQVQFRRGLARAYNVLAIGLDTQGKFAEAFQYYLLAESLFVAFPDTLGWANAVNNIGTIYAAQGDDAEAARYFYRANALYSSIKDTSGIAYTYSNIASSLLGQHDYKEAITYSSQALGILYRLHDTKEIASCLNTQGESYLALKEYKRAWDCFQTVMALSSTSTNVTIEQADAQRNIAIMWKERKNFMSSIHEFEKAIHFYRRIGNPAKLSSALAAFAHVHRLMEHWEKSRALLLEAKNLAFGVGAKKEELHVLLELAALSEARHLNEEALTYYKTYLTLRDSVFNEEKTSKMQEMQVRFDVERKDQALKFAEQVNKVQFITLERQRIIGVALLFAFVGVIAVTLWLLRLYEAKKLAHSEIERQMKLLEEQSQQIELAHNELRESSENLANVNREVLKTQAELESVVQELEHRNHELVDTEKFRLKMLGTVSHDLKGPIASVVGLSSVLLDNPALEESTHNIIKHIYEVGERMNRLVHDLLDTAAGEMGKMDLFMQQTEISDLMATAIAHYFHAATEKNQIFIQEGSAEYWVFGDTQRLMQVFDNLVSNAVKYSPIGGRIWVRFSQDEAKVRMTITDEGEGLSQEDQQKLFGFFQRLSTQPTAGESSSGVGLSIVKHILELHGGCVWCESELGKGATFVVELPVA